MPDPMRRLVSGPRSANVGYALALLGGTFGLHRIYLRRPFTGLAMFAGFWASIAANGLGLFGLASLPRGVAAGAWLLHAALFAVSAVDLAFIARWARETQLRADRSAA